MCSPRALQGCRWCACPMAITRAAIRALWHAMRLSRHWPICLLSCWTHRRSMIKAILWDVDGTLAETERDGHLVAFNEAFEALGLPWRWSEERYGELLAVAGGRERLVHDMQAHHGRAPTDPHQ